MIVLPTTDPCIANASSLVVGKRRPQFALIRKACEAYGLETIEGAGYEGDDVIASLALEVK